MLGRTIGMSAESTSKELVNHLCYGFFLHTMFALSKQSVKNPIKKTHF